MHSTTNKKEARNRFIRTGELGSDCEESKNVKLEYCFLTRTVTPYLIMPYDVGYSP